MKILTVSLLLAVASLSFAQKGGGSDPAGDGLGDGAAAFNRLILIQDFYQEQFIIVPVESLELKYERFMQMNDMFNGLTNQLNLEHENGDIDTFDLYQYQFFGMMWLMRALVDMELYQDAMHSLFTFAPIYEDTHFANNLWFRYLEIAMERPLTADYTEADQYGARLLAILEIAGNPEFMTYPEPITRAEELTVYLQLAHLEEDQGRPQEAIDAYEEYFSTAMASSLFYENNFLNEWNKYKALANQHRLPLMPDAASIEAQLIGFDQDARNGDLLVGSEELRSQVDDRTVFETFQQRIADQLRLNAQNLAAGN